MTSSRSARGGLGRDWRRCRHSGRMIAARVGAGGRGVPPPQGAPRHQVRGTEVWCYTGRSLELEAFGASEHGAMLPPRGIAQEQDVVPQNRAESHQDRGGHAGAGGDAAAARAGGTQSLRPGTFMARSTGGAAGSHVWEELEVEQQLPDGGCGQRVPAGGHHVRRGLYAARAGRERCKSARRGGPEARTPAGGGCAVRAQGWRLAGVNMRSMPAELPVAALSAPTEATSCKGQVDQLMYRNRRWASAMRRRMPCGLS
ncbi:uncharacterized protein LOC116945813 isoform X4 [Petromyzon marinus]|uniref:uncharacterized protein LOC116945813 isoform X4 n=1 Tax=Petromyzon marinus TaxID=7757 RepID=UPI003F70B6DE